MGICDAKPGMLRGTPLGVNARAKCERPSVNALGCIAPPAQLGAEQQSVFVLAPVSSMTDRARSNIAKLKAKIIDVDSLLRLHAEAEAVKSAQAAELATLRVQRLEAEDRARASADAAAAAKRDAERAQASQHGHEQERISLQARVTDLEAALRRSRSAVGDRNAEEQRMVERGMRAQEDAARQRLSEMHSELGSLADTQRRAAEATQRAQARHATLSLSCSCSCFCSCARSSIPLTPLFTDPPEAAGDRDALQRRAARPAHAGTRRAPAQVYFLSRRGGPHATHTIHTVCSGHRSRLFGQIHVGIYSGARRCRGGAA